MKQQQQVLNIKSIGISEVAYLFQDLFLSFGFDSSVADVNVGIIDKEGKKYVMEEFMDEFNLNKVKTFIASFAHTKGKCICFTILKTEQKRKAYQV